MLFINDPRGVGASPFSTPETALVVANLFSWPLSPKWRLMLQFVRKEKVASGVYDFVFKADRRFLFKPCQYGMDHADG